ncbi:hypothetical protein Zmor_010311 [Zophobas morio]|uniref:Odorant receptor n=1 Tax=Zophobas morio TaxID=2755281 RepID=A0AA38IP55_9CUCU|nr:hypothetical protein Zmor_010311 [Zophobas morio]
MVNLITKSFSLNLKLLKIMGLYSFGNTSILLKVRAYVLYFVLLVVTTGLIFFKTVTEKSANNMETNAMVAYVAESGSFCFKLVPFLRNGERIRRCINFFGQEMFAPKTDYERNILKECIWVCRRNSIVYFYGILVTLIGWNSPVLFVKGRKLQLRLWLPYDPSTTVLRYYSTFFFITAANVYDAFAGTIIDPLIGGLAYHATAQLKILKYNLQHIGKHLDGSNKYVINFHCVHKHLKNCVNHHKKILWFIEEYEECFSWSIFCQFAGSLLTICFCCIGLILVSINSVEAFTYLTGMIDISFQILFYCHYGTLLYEEVKKCIELVCETRLSCGFLK